VRRPPPWRPHSLSVLHFCSESLWSCRLPMFQTRRRNIVAECGGANRTIGAYPV
jgi:hypothetical protein